MKKGEALGLPLMISKLIRKERLSMSDKGKQAQTFLSDREQMRFNIWCVRNVGLCDALQGDEALLMMVYRAVTDVRSIYLSGFIINEDNVLKVEKAIKHLMDVNEILDGIKKKLLDDGFVEDAKKILMFSVGLDNGDLKWSKRKLSNYANEMHKKIGAKYEIPELVESEIWGNLKHGIVPKLCIWHISYLVCPTDMLGSSRLRKQIKMDLFDAIQSGWLVGNTNPPKLPNIIGTDEVDRWEVHIDDFKRSLSSHSLKRYFEGYEKVWESFLEVRTKPIAFLENPEGLLDRALDMTGNAVDAKDFWDALQNSLQNQGEERDFSRAFDQAISQVEKEKADKGYKVVNAFDEYQEMVFSPKSEQKQERKVKKRASTIKRHREWLEYGKHVCLNWASCRKPGQREYPTVTSVCWLISSKFGLKSETTPRKQIGGELQKFIDDMDG